MAWVNPSLFSSGQTAGVSANLNLVVADLLVPGSASTTYTPVWGASVTNPTISSGTITGNYWQIGKLVIGKFKITMGTTTNVGSGNYTVSLPVATAVGYGTEEYLGGGFFKHTAGSRYQLSNWWNTSTTLALLYISGTGVTASLGSATPTAPTSGDVISGQFMYESA